MRKLKMNGDSYEIGARIESGENRHECENKNVKGKSRGEEGGVS